MKQTPLYVPFNNLLKMDVDTLIPIIISESKYTRKTKTDALGIFAAKKREEVRQELRK